MAKVFMYTEAAEIPAKHLTALRKAGVVPVRVASFDEARFVDAELPVSGNDLAQLAIQVIADTGYSGPGRFVERLADLLKKQSGTNDD